MEGSPPKNATFMYAFSSLSCRFVSAVAVPPQNQKETSPASQTNKQKYKRKSLLRGGDVAVWEADSVNDD